MKKTDSLKDKGITEASVWALARAAGWMDAFDANGATNPV